MIYRIICLLVVILVYTSCKQVSSTKATPVKDTIVDFSSVDESPTFKECESLLGNAKTNCFRTNMRKTFTKALKKYTISSRESLEETILVTLVIDKEGKMYVKNVDASELLKSLLPQIDTILEHTTEEFPNLFPATKRGIPVTTQYTLPINIKTKE